MKLLSRKIDMLVLNELSVYNQNSLHRTRGHPGLNRTTMLCLA
ncbi:Uncharacterized protein APZ42_001687 [Daphnia magna]|uniref:Uncharacterized protein n=1 Tax=Daphnia magna TaxID=35525 RepID=A0A164ITS2_9CRUS|nr:Uncharacterized protein APZ42_001687 [Daphnia magna]